MGLKDLVEFCEKLDISNEMFQHKGDGTHTDKNSIGPMEVTYQPRVKPDRENLGRGYI